MTTIEELEQKIDQLQSHVTEIHKGIVGLKTVFSAMSDFLGLLQANFKNVDDLKNMVNESDVNNKRTEIIYKWIGKFYTDLYSGNLKIIKEDDDTFILKRTQNETIQT